MPNKRKRAAQGDDGDRATSRRKKDLDDTIANAKKQLHRELKTAKGFERQKLGKRFTSANTAGKPEEVARINREIKILKELDLGKTGDAYICKTLLKIKAIEKSDKLPKEIRNGVESRAADMSEEDKLAWGNVTSGMFNMKIVKNAMAQIVKDVSLALGISPPAKGQKEKTVSVKGILKSAPSPRMEEASDEYGERNTEEVEWEGLESSDEDDKGADGEDDIENTVEIDDETLAKYTALLGGSSDEESFDEEEYKAKRQSLPSERLSLSLSPSPSLSSSDSEHDSEDGESHISRSSSPQARKVTKAAKVPREPPKGNTFLPSLMGGYFSGSESEASELEDDIPKVRKNRKGQMARRAISEKKYGAKANHIQKGLGAVGTSRDDGWDAKLGATDGKKVKGRGRGGFADRGEGRQREARDFRQATGDNAMPVAERKKRGTEKRDDVGKLHASWEAAKKAKMEQKTATFAGKKVVFN